jgi:hypothetical protein
MGRFRFDVPVRIGENPVELVAYGPGGQVRNLSRSVNLDGTMVRPGQLQYGVAMGACRTALCTASLNSDLRYGVAPGWSARLGYDHFSRNAADLQHPYLGVTGYLGNGMWFDADQTFNAVSRAGLRFEPSLGFRTRIEAARFAQGVTAPILTPDGRESQITGTVQWTPDDGALGSVELTLDRIEQQMTTITSSRLTGSLNSGPVRLLPSMRFTSGERRRDEFAAGITALIMPIDALLGPLAATTFRLQLEGTPEDGLATGALWASTRAAWGIQLEVGANWRRGIGTAFTMRSSTSLGGTRIHSTVVRREDGSMQASPYIRGGMTLDPVSGAMHFSTDNAGERAGVSGMIWIDENNNGNFDPGETPAVGVRLIVGNRTARTDDRGFYQLFGLTPYLPVATAIDSTSLPSPLLIATLPRRGIAVVPYRVERLDVPLVPGGILDGRIEEANLSAADGVEVEMVHLPSGIRRQVMTFNDGGVYVMGLLPGEWRVSAGPGTSRTVTVVSGIATPLRIRRPAP